MKRFATFYGWLAAAFLVVILIPSIMTLRTVQGKRDALVEAMESVEMVSHEFQELQRRHDLAIEFGFTPIIVEIVDHHSRALLLEGGEEFRLIQTPEYLTHIFLSLIYAESKGKPSAVGDKGKARGLTQIWTSTAKEYEEAVTEDALLDPGTNIAISFLHFRHLLKEYKGNFTLVLLAWNRGQSRVDKLISWGTSPANGYGEMVFSASVTASHYAVASSTSGR